MKKWNFIFIFKKIEHLRNNKNNRIIGEFSNSIFSKISNFRMKNIYSTISYLFSHAELSTVDNLFLSNSQFHVYLKIFQIRKY